MTSLDELFPEGPRKAPGGTVLRVDDAVTEAKLTQLLGAPKAQAERPSLRGQTDRVVAMVAAAAGNAQSMASTDASAPRTRKVRRRRDWLTIAAVAVAVLTLGAAGAVGAVQAATASPTSSALESLRLDEAVLHNSILALTSTHESLSTKVAGEKADAAALRSALVDSSVAPDPRERDSSITMAIIAPEVLDDALAKIDAYLATLDATVIPAAPAPYTRPAFDESSIEEVGRAVDAVAERLSALDGAASEMSAARTNLDEAMAAFAAERTALAATFPAAAQTVLADAPDADDTPRDLVTATAAQVASSQLAGQASLATLPAYRDAVVGAIADQVRVEQERAEAERAERERNNNGNGPGQPTPQPTPDPTDPTDPPVDPPVDPPTEGTEG